MKLPEPSHLLELWASGEFTEERMLHDLRVLQMGAIVICPVYGMLGVVFHFGSRFTDGCPIFMIMESNKCGNGIDAGGGEQ